MPYPNDMALAELHAYLLRTLDKWAKARDAGEWIWAAYYANDLESATRRLTTITHHLVEDHYANSEAALKRSPSSVLPPT